MFGVAVALSAITLLSGAIAAGVAYQRRRFLARNPLIARFRAASAQLNSADALVRLAGVYAMAEVADEFPAEGRQQCVDALCAVLRRRPDATKTAGSDGEIRRTVVRVIAGRLRPGAAHDWRQSGFDFRDAHFADADFSGVRIGYHAVDFRGAKFSGHTDFGAAEFISLTLFANVTFAGPVTFERAVFSYGPNFSSATFAGPATFREATFADLAFFDGATFAAAAFERAFFSGRINFFAAIFTGHLAFEGATFAGRAIFGEAKFEGGASFEGATFAGGASFELVTFRSAVDFRRVDFGTGGVRFRHPLFWEPAPTFDWDRDLTLKPSNVRPRPWPPRVRVLPYRRPDEALYYRPWRADREPG